MYNNSYDEQEPLLFQNYQSKVREEQTIPVWEKANLTIHEAATYSNIGINRIDKMLRSPDCPFVLYVGSKKLVKRKAFEEYLSRVIYI